MDGQSKDGKEFSNMDVAFIRVLEDLIETLIVKGVVRMTDLPAAAQQKLNERKGLRRRLNTDLNLLDDHETLI